MATIEKSGIDADMLNIVDYGGKSQATMAIFDNSGNLVSKVKFDDKSDIGRKSKYSYGVMVNSKDGYKQGQFMLDDMLAMVDSKMNHATLMYAGTEIFRSGNCPLNTYIDPWVTSNRGAILAGKKVFFVSSDGKAISLLMDKVAIDRGDQIERVHHVQTHMVDIWADCQYLVCLSKDGKLDILRHRGKNSRAICSEEISKRAFADTPFAVGKNVAIALTGCTQYLAVVTYNHESKTNSTFLLDRRGKVKSKATDMAQAISLSGPNPVHRMEFTVHEKCIYLVAQNLFSFLNLYLVNPLRTADLIYIRTITMNDSAVLWPLIPIPGKPGYMISSGAGIIQNLLHVSINYGLST